MRATGILSGCAARLAPEPYVGEGSISVVEGDLERKAVPSMSFTKRYVLERETRLQLPADGDSSCRMSLRCAIEACGEAHLAETATDDEAIAAPASRALFSASTKYQEEAADLLDYLEFDLRLARRLSTRWSSWRALWEQWAVDVVVVPTAAAKRQLLLRPRWRRPRGGWLRLVAKMGR